MTRRSNVSPVNINSHSIVTISNFTIATVYQIQVCRNIITYRCISFLRIISIRIITVLTSITDMPTIDILTCVFSVIATNVTGIRGINRKHTIFKIIHDFRCFTETNISSYSLFFLTTNNSCQGSVSQSGTCITSGKLITNNRSQRIIR